MNLLLDEMVEDLILKLHKTINKSVIPGFPIRSLLVSIQYKRSTLAQGNQPRRRHATPSQSLCQLCMALSKTKPEIHPLPPPIHHALRENDGIKLNPSMLGLLVLNEI